MLVAKLLVNQDNEMSRELLRKIFIGNRYSKNDKNKGQNGQNRVRDWKERERSKSKTNQEEKNVAEEQAAKVSSQYWKPPIYYNDDDDNEESSIHLRDIISELPLSVAIAPNFLITDSLIMEDEHLNTILKIYLYHYESECDMPVYDDSSSKNEGLDDIIIFRIELNYEILDAIIESFSPSPIPIEDSDSLMEEIDIFLALDDSIPPGIENDDYDSEGDDLPGLLKPLVARCMFCLSSLELQSLSDDYGESNDPNLD
ncbi:hypothetical protein Tco_0135079 [Tanacetum coccineum]